MSAIREEGIGYGGTDKDYPSPNAPTDEIISKYENKLNGSIASKILNASKKGQVPVFTKEEIAYLTKKAVEESPLTEVNVIIPSPAITLKKGNTEINIKHAAELVKKMEEKYPTTNRYGTEPTASFRLATSEESERMSNPSWFSGHQPPQEIKTVNKNAYEIRMEVLSMAVDFLRWQSECNVIRDVQTGKLEDPSFNTIPRLDDVLETAKKLYSFVENRR